jgi:hypothetical protein
MATDADEEVRLKLICETELIPEEQEAAAALNVALIECGMTDSDQRSACRNRLINLPGSLLLPMRWRRGTIGAPPKGFVDRILGSDRDLSARLLRLDENGGDPDATWESLSRAEQMRASRLRRSLADSHPADISTERKGRPAEFDSALVLYLMFVLTEAFGRSKFSYSTKDEKRGGPMLRALMAALAFQRAAEQRMQVALDCLGPIGTADTPRLPAPEAVVTRVVKVVSSAEFRKEAARQLLALTAEAVAASPATFRHLIAIVTSRQRRSRRTD